MAVTSEVLDVAARTFVDRYYGGQSPHRACEVRATMCSVIEAIQPMLLEAAAPQTDEERLRAALELCSACCHYDRGPQPYYYDQVVAVRDQLHNVLATIAGLRTRKTMRLMNQIGALDGGHIAWYDLPDGTCETRLFGPGQDVPKEIEMPVGGA